MVGIGGTADVDERVASADRRAFDPQRSKPRARRCDQRARIVTLHVLISAKNIPRYQVFLAGVLACRLQRLEASIGKTGR
jgi:hypothetical protein